MILAMAENKRTIKVSSRNNGVFLGGKEEFQSLKMPKLARLPLDYVFETHQETHFNTSRWSKMKEKKTEKKAI